MVIRSPQLNAFRQHRLQQFEGDMLSHIREHFPEHHRAIPEARLREIIRLAHSRAGQYGLATVRSVCIYLNCMLWMGSRFDTDIQYPWARAILTDPDFADPGDRATRLSEVAVAQMLRLAGPQNQHISTLTGRLLRELPADPAGFFQSGVASPGEFLAALLPSKWELLPEELQGGLFHAARRLAARYGLGEPAEVLLYATLMFLLGSSFDTDPQFAWAGAILEDADFSPEQKTRALIRSGLEQLRAAVDGDPA